ncbi:SUN domain-containing ossification factor-like isoform X2 [Dendronephthya gigantea]|uniref:SUN domain-containing ossification factor-like isoform X2 n=1 Tax=Dendronephthya gigantea TaxID=151771 RepID=UPI00106DD1F9|nr:SUN domain-containing ossification factor-like isoform X2 [Dendronephthya gigantea]
MASKLCRCIQLWLTFLLCWFALRGDPVTQETESDIESLSTEKENIGFTEQKATPHLALIHQTQTIIHDIVELNTLVTRPAIAPATPWDDTQVISTVSGGDAESSIEHQIITEKQIPDVEISISNIDDSKSAGENQKEIEVGSSSNAADKDIAVEITGNKDNISEISSRKASDKDGGELEKVEDREEQRQIPEGVENVELSENQQFSLNEEKAISSNKKDILDEMPPASELPTHQLDSKSQNLQVDEDLPGTQDGFEATQEELENSQDALGAAQEDMPSFNEWSQKFLAQEEEKKVQLNNEKGTSDPGIPQKKKTIERKQNNYASVDCGANIPEKNSEAQNAHSILLENKDLYMLNPCSANIWFIVELCDHVQVTSLQLANFEMFSSTTKEFQVSFSTRYPTREWSQLQTFEAKPEKSIQTFTIDPIFAKYIKIEQLTHHGSEHYCPWSLLRVYGNSMVEEYEEHESSHDENTNVDEDLNTSSNTTENKNQAKGILKSATDAVLNFVKETAKKLVKTEEQNNSTENATTYSEDNSSQPLQPKTIVQLMPREDFEASCHGDSDDAPNPPCLPGDECVSTEYLPHSYQAFLEIVHNVCGRNFRRAKACFANFSKSLVGNVTNQEASRKNLTEEIEIDSRGNKEEINTEVDVSDGESKADERSSKDIGNNVDSDIVSIEKMQKPEDTTTSSRTASSEDSGLSESVHVDSQTSPDSTTTSTVLHSSTCNNCVSSSSSSSVPSATISSGVTSSINDLDFASSPTPLAQPPLAVNDNPNTIEPPTPPPEGVEKEIIIQASSDSPNSVSCDNFDCVTATTETIPNAVPSPSSTLQMESMPTLSSTVESGAQMPKISTSHQDTPVDEGLSRDNNVPEGSDRDTNEHGEGTPIVDKEHDIVDPHVDVLKTTLTDAETKEGRAEPEQPNEDTARDLIAKPNKTTISQLEGEKEIEKPDIDVGSKDKEVEAHQDELEDSRMGSEVNEKVETIEEQKDAVLLNEDHRQTELPDPSLIEQDFSPLSEGQCEMKDATVSRNPEDFSSPNLDPGPTINAEAVTTHVGNGNTYGKKESIFVTLSRKIKALEQNVTMTNLFLEELSQRYRKSMDEMQKKMEKKFSMLSKNSKLLTKVNLAQNSTILALTSRVKELEVKLNEAISRLKVVNQEVVERHVVGLCLQILFLIIMWFLLRPRATGNTDPPARHTLVGNGHVKNGSVLCNGTDYRQQNGNIEHIENEKNYLEECSPSKPLTLDATSDTKRRRRRKNRPNSVVSDHSFDATSNQAQNIVSRTAGLLFHAQGAPDNLRPVAKDSGTQRSQSNDSIHSLSQDERRWNVKKSASSPKSKKVFFRNKDDTHDGKTKTFAEARLAGGRPNAPGTKLVRSKSSGECYENKLALSDIAISTAESRGSLGNARCLPQPTSNPFKDQKRSWIWGLG